MEATLEQPVVPVDDQPAESQTPVTPATEPEQPQAPQADDSDIQDYLSTAGIAPSNSGEEAESEDRRTAVLKKIPDEVRSEVEELFAERDTAREQQVTQRNEVRAQRFRDRINGLKPFLIEKGLTEADAQIIQNTFNNHHNEGFQLAQHEAQAPFIASLLEEGAKGLPAGQRDAFKNQSFKSASDFTKAIITAARTGYVTEKQVNDKVAEGLKGYKKYLEDKKLLVSAHSPDVSLGGGNGSLSRETEDKLLLDPKTDIKVVEQILARRNGQ